MDFWDAFLWIVAFVFIERNVVFWEEELEANQAVAESNKEEVVNKSEQILDVISAQTNS